MEQLHIWLDLLCETATLMFEFIGVIILILSGIIGIYNYIKKSPIPDWNWQRMALGLEFKMEERSWDCSCNRLGRNRYSVCRIIL